MVGPLQGPRAGELRILTLTVLQRGVYQCCSYVVLVAVRATARPASTKSDRPTADSAVLNWVLVGLARDARCRSRRVRSAPQGRLQYPASLTTLQPPSQPPT